MERISPDQQIWFQLNIEKLDNRLTVCTSTRQAESLKKELSNGRNGLSSDGSGKGEWVSSRTMLQDVYRRLLITNLEYALDKKIEQELWNFAFKNHITTLQHQVKDKTNTFRAEAQSQLTSFLDAASGFYIELLDDLCHAFHINIPYRVHSSKLVFLKDSKSVKCKSIAQPERPSCQYMCQHCLVHLGDIARYRNQIAQAESYYRYAAQLVPSNGQPYNQLAILAAAGGDVLSTAFYYCRSLAVKCPFPGSDTNLRRQLAKIMAGDEPRHTKISTSELVKFCLKFHACIYLKQNESDLTMMVEKLSGYVRAHLRAGSLSRQQMIHMTFLNLFSLHHLSPNGVNASGGPSTVSADESEEKLENESDDVNASSDSENTSWSALLTFTMHMLGGLLACVPAHSDDSSDLEHHALPSIKLTLDWIVSNISTLRRSEVAQNSRVWPRLAKVLNALGNQDKANNMDNLHLPEDLEVRGFVGLKTALSKLDFLSGIGSGVPANMEHSCRCYRLYQLGLSIAGANGDLLSFCEESNGTVFSSSISPSPQHAAKINGVEEQSEEEFDTEEEEESSAPSPIAHGSLASRDNFAGKIVSIESSTKRSSGRTKGVLKVASDDHSSSRKRNRAPRMQNVGVQIKPDHKLKVIKEEDGGGLAEGFIPVGEYESGRSSSESSTGDVSPSAITHSRTGHRVTFAATQQVSPIQYPQDDSPSPVAPSFMEQGNMMVGNVSMYPKSSNHMAQPPFMPGMHIVPQQMGPIYRHPPSGNPILTGPFARRPAAPYTAYQQNMMARPHIQIPSYQHTGHSSNPPPPNPADLPKPVFQSSLFPQSGAVENRAPTLHSQINQLNSDVNLEQVMKLQRPTDLGYMPQMHPNPSYNMSGMSPTGHDSNIVQRPTCPTMAAQFPNRPNMNASVMHQLRLQEMTLSSDMPGDVNLGVAADPSGMSYHHQGAMKYNYQNQSFDFPSYVKQRQPQHQMLARCQANVLATNTEALAARQEVDVSRLPPELARSYFPGNLMASSNPIPTGGSNNTSSTSSPTPGSLNQLSSAPNTTSSPQAGGINTMNYPNVGNVLGPGLSSMMRDRPSQGSSDVESLRRPMTLPGGQMHPNVGYVGSPSQKLTPSGIGRFLNMDLSVQGESQFKESGPPSMFLGGQAPVPPLAEELRSRNRVAAKQNAELYTISQERVKAIFEERDRGGMDSRAQIAQSSAQVSQSAAQQFHDPLLSKEDKDSYKLFPVTDSLWESRSLGLGNLGTIGSERAAAQQNSQNYSPWSGAAQVQASSNLPEKVEMPRTSENLPSQSFWSTPMVTSGPSALEQLIRQQQNVTRDKSPP